MKVRTYSTFFHEITYFSFTTESVTYARERFGNQKAISSDEYHGTGAYDAAAASQARERLQQFSGATAISSNAYFGRDEEEYSDNLEQNLLGVDGLGNLENNAREMIRKVMDTTGIHDLEGLQNAVRNGALKVSLVSYKSLSLLTAITTVF
jgi:ADP-ribosylation factor GTPase-activating protein 2/3